MKHYYSSKLFCLFENRLAIISYFIDFWKFSVQKWSNFNVKSVTSCQAMISHLVFVMNIISHVQTLILYIVSLMPVSFACRDYLRTPFIETVDKINRHWQVCTFTFNKKLFSLYSKLIFSISRISIVQLRLAVLIFFGKRA